MEIVHVKDKVKGAVYIGRGSVFGNPFVIGKDGSRIEVVLKYREYCIDRLYWDEVFYDEVLGLAGKTLACFCGENVCHGDVLIEMVERLKE